MTFQIKNFIIGGIGMNTYNLCTDCLYRKRYENSHITVCTYNNKLLSCCKKCPAGYNQNDLSRILDMELDDIKNGVLYTVQ